MLSKNSSFYVIAFFSLCAVAYCGTGFPGAQRPSANQRVHRSPAAWDSEREFQCRELSRQAGSSLLHPSLQYSCSEVAIDPEDPSPHVKQAYLLDTRSTATVSECTENSSSCESTGRTRRSSEHFDRMSDGSTGTKGNSNDYRRPPVSFSGSRLSASRASHERVWPRGAPGSTEASVAGVSETTPRQRARNWCPRSTTTKRKGNSTTKPSKVPPQAAFAGFLPHSAAGLCGASATLPETERSRVVEHLLQSLSQKPSAEQVSEPDTLTGSRLREEPAVGEQQIPSPHQKEPATICYNTPPTEEALAVLEKEASFSAGVTAYYADFIDGQLLALWHFTVSPSSRDHSAFQYSLSDWKIYDCLHKIKNHHEIALVKDKQVQHQTHTEPLQPSRRPPAAERASAPTVNAHTAEVGIAYMANQREATPVGDRRTEATSKIPVFCMSNRGDVWTLLDWKCLSFEPQGDVTVFDFCPMSDQKLHLKRGNT